jgi:hypothetical protein
VPQIRGDETRDHHAVLERKSGEASRGLPGCQRPGAGQRLRMKKALNQGPVAERGDHGWFEANKPRPEAMTPLRRSANSSTGRGCVHLHSVAGRPPSGQGCAECLESGSEWVHLCICMACGHVGCCDCSPHRHAMGHWLANRDHPLVRSYEDGEDWWWCYPEELRFEVRGAPPSPSHG